MIWFDELPERLEYELRQLDELGLAYCIDEERRAAGQLVLTVRYGIDGVEHPLLVIYPSGYPYFPFQVFADTLNLPRHQDPYSKVLCFIADAFSEWETSDTVGAFLRDRLPDVLRANAGDADVLEAREGAPASGYLHPTLGSLVVVAEGALPLDRNQGSMTIGFERGCDPNQLLRGAVLEVRARDGAVLAQAHPRIAARTQGSCTGRWVRLPARPRSSDATAVLEEAIAVWTDLRTPVIRGGPDVVGVVFQDEARYREFHDLWTFVVRRKDRAVAVRRKGQRLPPGDQYSVYLARADRGNRDDLVVRTPRLRPLAEKKAAVFGLGALGSTLAMQLARAGIGRLYLVDHDVVEAGNVPRWAVGWPALGWPKRDVMVQHIQQNYPFVEVQGSNLKVGSALHKEDVGLDTRILDSALENAHVVIDCTVEKTVHHFLSRLAWGRGVPYVWMSARAGGWGGFVGRTVPGPTAGCWTCFKHHQEANRYRIPSEEEGADVHPIGCFSPTFTGAGFDLDEVALMGTRMCAATLCRGEAGGYPDFEWDIGIVDLWRDGRPIAPDWERHRLERHPDCDAHG